MRKLAFALCAASVTLSGVASTAADAARHRHTYVRRCQPHGGTTGAIVGGGAGALIGHAVTGHGLAGPIVGGVGGALLGRHIERHSRRGC